MLKPVTPTFCAYPPLQWTASGVLVNYHTTQEMAYSANGAHSPAVGGIIEGNCFATLGTHTLNINKKPHNLGYQGEEAETLVFPFHYC